jgi:anti-sigma B factor antagonist
MDINVRPRNQVQVLQMRGDLKLGIAADELRSTLDDLVGQGNFKFVFNMSEVPVMDSSGIGLLVRYLTSVKRQQGNIKLVNPSKFTLQTLKIVGVLSLFEVFDDENKAVESFG